MMVRLAEAALFCWDDLIEIKNIASGWVRMAFAKVCFKSDQKFFKKLTLIRQLYDVF